jgi:hypothetical protein
MGVPGPQRLSGGGSLVHAVAPSDEVVPKGAPRRLLVLDHEQPRATRGH